MKNKISKITIPFALSLIIASCSDAPRQETNETTDSNDPNWSPIKILSLDGGGIRGIIPAHLLAGIEEETGKRIYELFDIVAGTSAGGIIALITTTPNDEKTSSFMSAKEIEEFYFKYAARIFDYSCNSLVPKAACGLQGPLYKFGSFERLMKEFGGDKLFKETLKPTLIVTFDIERNQGYSLESDLPLFGNLTKVDVARATSAAPTYFAPKILLMKNFEGGTSEHYMVDGVFYKKNPSFLAYHKAIKLFGAEAVKKRGILLVSIGTGQPLQNTHDAKELLTAGYAKWAPIAINAIIDGSSNQDHGLAEDLFQRRPSSKYIRIQSVLDNVKYPEITELDNISSDNLKVLVATAHDTKNTKEYKEAIATLKSISK